VSVHTYLTDKIIDFSDNKFHFMRKISHKCYLAFPLSKMVDLNLKTFLVSG